MTPQQHLDEAERLLVMMRRHGNGWDGQALLATALEATGHAVVALAIESGVPHTAPAAEEAPSVG